MFMGKRPALVFASLKPKFPLAAYLLLMLYLYANTGANRKKKCVTILRNKRK